MLLTKFYQKNLLLKIDIKYIFLFIFTFAVNSVNAYNVATWNIRINVQEDSNNGDVWENRSKVIVQMIRFYDFDIIGIQEDYRKEIKSLKLLLPDYRFVGFPNHENGYTGSHNSILVNSNKFSVVDSGMFYLAPVDSLPQIGWNAQYIRSCTWIKIKDKKNLNEMWVFNTHIDYMKGDAQEKSSLLILDKIKTIAGPKSVSILMGDCNFNELSEGYKIINGSSLLEDSFDKASQKLVTSGTLNRFDPNYYHPERIDHIFVTEQFQVEKYGILTDSYWYQGRQRLPSDHYPVLVRLSIR